MSISTPAGTPTPGTDPQPPDESAGSGGSSTAADRRRRAIAALNQYIGVLTVLVALIVILAISQPQFLTVENFINIAETNAVLLIVATGMTFVLLVGGIDLSVGGTIGLCSVALWWLTANGVNVVLACALVVLLALALGFGVNGFLIGKVGLSFLVVTIGTASIFRSVAQVWTDGQSQSLYEQQFLVDLGANRFLGIPWTVWIAGIAFITCMMGLRYSGFGRMLYAVGGNSEAARLAGINTSLIRITVFGISAGMAGVAAILNSARITTAAPDAQTGIELTASAAVLLGGTSFMGGRGSLLGTIFGVLFLGVLSNGLTLIGISPYWAGVLSGGVLIIAVAIDRFRNGRAMP